MAILMGVAPNIFLKPLEPAVRRTIQQIVGTPGPVNAGVPGTVPQGALPSAPVVPTAAPAEMAPSAVPVNGSLSLSPR